MQAQDVLPPELQKRRLESEDILLAYEDALRALDAFGQAQWAMSSWEARSLDNHGDLRSIHVPHLITQWRFFDWKREEPWEHYVKRSTHLCEESLQHFKSQLDQIPEKQAQNLSIRLDALGPHPYVEKIDAIHDAYFPTSHRLPIDSSTQSIPLVMATVRKSTHSFSHGQKIYIYDTYWGMNERAQVIGKFCRKHRWIRGTCPIASLDNFRPTVVFHPSVTKKLSEGCSISYALFERFFPMPL